METLPNYVGLLFIAITTVTIALFYKATNKNKVAIAYVLVMAIFTGVMSSQDFFLDNYNLPPRFILLIAPTIVVMIITFLTKKGKAFIDSIDLEMYGYLHSVRVAVEIVLLWLFLHGVLPESMTFEGRNFDILSGLTAPLVAYFGYRQRKMSNGALLAWNVICLGLVLQVVITGILSVPSPIQQLSFEQPNIAVLYFPFVWLPAIVVPVVIFGHLAAIRRAILKIQ
ncbi:hypothetical protein [Fulvivirga lutimaris]|uniref:hypothetical protein n=1 Tax=Fulvivirga lutimaris TaxID=1819566 RepID=UPI0012BBFA45|nr:hypothetical protein [Fulvivirga lutimaris]MTI39426.1 hypothetical protein [Fulvivirga lutimaris]